MTDTNKPAEASRGRRPMPGERGKGAAGKPTDPPADSSSTRPPAKRVAAKSTPLSKMSPEERLAKIKEMGRGVQRMYAEDTTNNTVNMLVTGESGSGKSFLARTCPTPVHFDSFDPGGAKGLRKEIEAGDIIYDNSYENEDPMNPTKYIEWKTRFTEREKSGYFEHIGTYYLDSSTTWGEAMMNWLLKKAGIPGQAPRFTHDYNPHKIEIRNMMRRILALPCTVVITGHLAGIKDEVSGRMTYRYMTTGQGLVTIPLLFDELYVLLPRQKGRDTVYEMMTASSGTYIARTRIGTDQFDAYEKPDIRYLMQKAKWPCPDKPNIFRITAAEQKEMDEAAKKKKEEECLTETDDS